MTHPYPRLEEIAMTVSDSFVNAFEGIRLRWRRDFQLLDAKGCGKRFRAHYASIATLCGPGALCEACEQERSHLLPSLPPRAPYEIRGGFSDHAPRGPQAALVPPSPVRRVLEHVLGWLGLQRRPAPPARKTPGYPPPRSVRRGSPPASA